LPSGAKATPRTPAVCPWRTSTSWPARVPEAHHPVLSGGRDPPAVGAEGHAVDHGGRPLGEEKGGPRLRRVPDGHRPILATAGDARAVGLGERRRQHLGAGMHIPWPGRGRTCRGHQLAERAAGGSQSGANSLDIPGQWRTVAESGVHRKSARHTTLDCRGRWRNRPRGSPARRRTPQIRRLPWLDQRTLVRLTRPAAHVPGRNRG
jgi:hypothetical protein